jgi:broad specificity phosphatase PhoE
MSLEIFIARHGQNEDNANGILNGHRDLPLTDIGRQQAKQLATGIKLSGINVDKILTSPLIRAVETAQIVASEIGSNPPEVMDELIERDFGVMTGKNTAQIEELCAPNIIKSNTITYFLNPEGAETFPQLIERGKKVLSNLGKMSLDISSVLLVCHGDIGKMIYCAQTGKDWRSVLEDFHFGNAELIDISRDGDVKTINIEQYNH